MAKMYEDMDLNELTAEAKGQILIGVGEGKFGSAVHQMMMQAWANGYRQHAKDELAKRAVALKEEAALKRKRGRPVPLNTKKRP